MPGLTPNALQNEICDLSKNQTNGGNILETMIIGPAKIDAIRSGFCNAIRLGTKFTQHNGNKCDDNHHDCKCQRFGDKGSSAGYCVLNSSLNGSDKVAPPTAPTSTLISVMPI